ncbi:MAG: Uma2 family endonuclease [Jatrophihabitans sp.]
MTVMPRESRDWTVDDLDELPDDGLQYELLDGLLLVTPAPIPDHQRFARGIFRLLDAGCPADRFEVFFAPLDWRPDPWTSLQPDVLVAARDRIGPKNITEPLALAVEVLSPSTRRKDMVLKRSKYQDAGVMSYWIVDPDGPAVTAYDLRNGKYVEVGAAIGDETIEVELPFPIRITPSALR